MTDPNPTLTSALSRSLGLLANPPASPDVDKGYLDLLGSPPVPDSAAAEGMIQAMWASPVVALVYDNAQAILRRALTVFQPPAEWLQIQPDGIVLDVGCGPASITASLAHAIGPGGLVVGIDRSEAMLDRAVRAVVGPQIAFVRADAQRLPLRDETVDAVVSMAVLQLVGDPAMALAEMARVLRPDGRLAVMVPIAGLAAPIWRRLPKTAPHLFGEDEVADILEDHGFVSVRTRSAGAIQWVRAQRG